MKGRVARYAQKGVSLIEALISLVILAVGVLSIAKLNNHFLEIGGSSKARTQAVQLAEAKVEQWRNIIVRASMASIENERVKTDPELIYGYSASGTSATQFRRWWKTAKTTDAAGDVVAANVEVYVNWDDRSGEEQQVVVRSAVAWDDPGMSTALLQSTKVPAGQYATTPTGRATLGAGNVRDVEGGTTDVTGDQGDGLKIVKGTTDEIYRLVDIVTGDIFLTASKPKEPLSQISGKVYVDQSQLSALPKSNIYVVISDASYCSMTPADTLATLGSVFKHFTYRCYLGANWYGNIGVVRTDDANTNDRVCVGDPAISPIESTSKSDNRHPALSANRMYRGYKETASGSNVYNATGIGILANGDYSAATYDGHDFLLTRITGNPKDSDCTAPLMLHDATGPAYDPFSGGAGGDATVHSPQTETALVYGGGDTVKLGNPGAFFCLSASCPDPLPDEISVRTVTVSGVVTRVPDSLGNKPTIEVPEISAGICKISEEADAYYKYSCSISLVGFTGSSWSGDMIVKTNGFVCWTGVGGTADPLPKGPTQKKNVEGAFTFSFTKQSVDIESSTLDFKVGKTSADCDK